jgi:hypothetical protein
LSSEDYYNLSGELSTIASIFAKIGKWDIAKCFLNRGAEGIYKDIKDVNPEDVLKSILDYKFSDDEREEILNKEPHLKKLFEDMTYCFNSDFFDFMMEFFIRAGNWKRFLEIHDEFKNKIKKCKISEEIIEKIIEKYEKSVSDKLLMVYLLKGDYNKCLDYVKLFKECYCEYWEEFDKMEKNKIDLIAYIANNLKNGIVKKEEWLNRLNEIYADVLNQPLKSTYKEIYHSKLCEILNYHILKEFIGKL